MKALTRRGRTRGLLADNLSKAASTAISTAELYAEDVHSGRLERSLSALSAAGAVVTCLEIWTEHDRASFGNRMMWWPVAIMPTAIPAGIAAVFSKRAAKTVLPAASLAIVLNGLQGTYLHWRGIAQKPGGWALASYNVEMGPPVFAPLLASLVGGMGLLAAVLRREDRA